MKKDYTINMSMIAAVAMFLALWPIIATLCIFKAVQLQVEKKIVKKRA